METGGEKVMRKLAFPFSAPQPVNERSMLPLTSAGAPRSRSRCPLLESTIVMSVLVAQFATMELLVSGPLNTLGEKVAPCAAYWLLNTAPAARLSKLIVTAAATAVCSAVNDRKSPASSARRSGSVNIVVSPWGNT